MICFCYVNIYNLYIYICVMCVCHFLFEHMTMTSYDWFMMYIRIIKSGQRLSKSISWPSNILKETW